MDYKMVNILTLLLGCACVSAQPGARPPAGPPTSRPAGPPTRPPAGPPTRPPAGPPTRPPAGPSTRPPASTAPPNDDVSPVPVVLSTDMLCIQSFQTEDNMFLVSITKMNICYTFYIVLRPYTTLGTFGEIRATRLESL
ncbi:hypothetical protein HOLleu_10321 [Holothuria leucospilota]|uniref:Uncharacterized protein n=1 Tax=Holothuria leucospilota TaxID=206669 RepID=A0A9Q1CE54_HOLLE|nr:hypothetical protein HOLleu_10321 [Holothuria leucospilota]